MFLSNEIKEKLTYLKYESEQIEEFSGFIIYNVDEIKKGQIGYSIDLEGNSLVFDEKGSWRPEWIVIGCETLCGDPIIIDTKEAGFPISQLMHGIGDWTGGTYLSESIDKFMYAIKRINDFIDKKSVEKITPRITCKDLENLINEIIKEDKYGDVDNWRAMLEPFFNSTEEYEDSITSKVKKMADQGMRIKEISILLDMSLSDTYIYLKRRC